MKGLVSAEEESEVEKIFGFDEALEVSHNIDERMYKNSYM
jgi:hypothetical protein